MSEKQRSLLYTVLAVVASGIVFFSLGMAVAGTFGFTQKNVVVENLGAESTTSPTNVFRGTIDLNTATVEDLMQIDGIGEKTAQSIIAYRESIGGFQYVEQLLYVDGIGETKYSRWVPYMTVNGVGLNGATMSNSTSYITQTVTTETCTTITTTSDVHPTTMTTYVNSESNSTVNGANTTGTSVIATTVLVGEIDLNTATLEQLMQIDGIGEKTAQSILAYRERVGGFTAVEQLLEIDGIGETKFNQWCRFFTVNGEGYSGTTTKKTTAPTFTTTTSAFTGIVDLNTATIEDLIQIDGIGEKTAENIIRYRDSIGGFSSVEQLMDVDGVGEAKFTKWSPYLVVKNAVSSTLPHAQESVPTTAANGNTYDLNDVTKEELMTIRGVGEKLADSIIQHREKIGGFTKIEQLLDVDGIGEGRFEMLCKYLTLEDD